MKTSRPLFFLAFLSAASLACAADLSEQDYFAELPEVLTVTRLAQPLRDTPGAMTVIDHETIRRSGARDITELLRLAPGFIVNHMESGGRPVASYHADYDGIVRHLQVMVDGRSLYSSLLVGTASYAMMGLVLEDIERIEILRGSNSASHGANAFMGVVNIVTRHAMDSHGKTVAVNFGEGGVRDGMARIGWGDRTASYRLTVARQGDAGYVNLADDKAIEQGHFRADWRLSASDELMLTAGHTQYAWGLQDSPTAEGRTESWHNNYLNLNWTRQLNATDAIKLSANFDTERYIDFFPFFRADGVSRRSELEVQHNFSAGTDWRFVWGGQYRREQVVSEDLFPHRPNQHFQIWRGFGNIEWRPHARWVLNVGGLVEDHSIVGTSTAPRFMVNFHALPGHTLRAGTTTAFKQPTLFELHADWRDGNGRARVLATGSARAERIDATEVGYFGEFRDWRLTADVRVFNEEVHSLLRYWRPPGATANDVVNLAGSTQHGWESQLRWRPRDGTEFWVNHTRLRLTPDAASPTPQDRYRAPRNISSIAWFQSLPYNLELSLIHYMLAERFVIRLSDRIPDFRQTDLRLARKFTLGATKAEAAIMVRAADGGGVDFVQRGQPAYEVDRRIHASLRLEF